MHRYFLPLSFAKMLLSDSSEAIVVRVMNQKQVYLNLAKTFQRQTDCACQQGTAGRMLRDSEEGQVHCAHLRVAKLRAEVLVVPAGNVGRLAAQSHHFCIVDVCHDLRLAKWRHIIIILGCRRPAKPT